MALAELRCKGPCGRILQGGYDGYVVKGGVAEPERHAATSNDGLVRAAPPPRPPVGPPQQQRDAPLP